MELAIKINSTSADQRHCQDGDVVCVVAQSQIYCCHAHMICHPRRFPLNAGGLRDEGTLLQKYMERTHSYKFSRLNHREIQRTNLLTGDEDTLGDTPNVAGEAIDVELFILRRVKSEAHTIFGASRGREVWYGKELPRSSIGIDDVWDDIETHSDYRKTDHGRWPFSDREKRAFLPVRCTGFRDGEYCDVSRATCATRHEALVVDGVTLTLHRYSIPYWDLAAELGIDVADVRNHDAVVDARRGGDISEQPHMDDVVIDKVAEGIVTV